MSTSTPSDRGGRSDQTRSDQTRSDQTRSDQAPVHDTGAHPTHDTHDTHGTHTGHTVAHEEPSQDRRSVLARQKEEHGGVKIGSAFFGFLTAVGVGVLLTALVTAAGAAVGLATGTDASEATDASSSTVETVGLIGGIVLLVIVFLAYYAGGYVAGRMARFNGIKQGLAVWLWALFIAIVVAVLGAVAGDQYNILADLNTFPRIPVSEGDLTRGGAIAAVVLVIVSLLGALAGGLGGMRFHRRVDKTGLPR